MLQLQLPRSMLQMQWGHCIGAGRLAALGSFWWAAISWQWHAALHVLLRSSKHVDSWGFQGGKRDRARAGRRSPAATCYRFSREDEHLMRQTAMEEVLKTFSKYSARLAKTKWSMYLIKNTRPIRASSKRKQNVQISLFKSTLVRTCCGKYSGSTCRSAALCSWCFLACLRVDFSCQRCFQLTSVSLEL